MPRRTAPQNRKNLSTQSSLILASILFVCILPACGAGRVAEVSHPEAAPPGNPPAVTDETTAASTTRAPMASPAVLFPRQRPGNDYMTAFGGGKLVLDERGCLRLYPRGDVIVWPHEHAVVTEASGEVEVLTGNGRVVARAGDDVSVGGGDVGGRAIDFVDPGSVPSMGELLRRCPGRFYVAGGEVRVVEDLTTGR